MALTSRIAKGSLVLLPIVTLALISLSSGPLVNDGGPSTPSLSDPPSGPTSPSSTVGVRRSGPLAPSTVATTPPVSTTDSNGTKECRLSKLASHPLGSDVHRCKAGPNDVVTLSDLPRCIADYFEVAYQRHEGFRRAAEATTARICGGDAVPRDRLELCDAVPELDAIYMVHYTASNSTPEKKENASCRRKAMDQILGTHRVPVDVWISPLDREELDAPRLECLYSRFEPTTYVGTAKKRRHVELPISRLKPTQVSVNSKHHLALYDAVKHGRRLVMIIEDDVLFRGHFWKRLQEVLDTLRTPRRPLNTVCHDERRNGEDMGAGFDFDVAMIGGCMNLHGYRRKYRASPVNSHIYRKQEARCAHAYIVTNRGAAALLQGMPATAPIDFQISRSIVERNLSTVWIEPYLSVQGAFPKCGSCVTMESLNAAGCKSIEKYSREYDIAYINDPAVCSRWDTVPAWNSLR